VCDVVWLPSRHVDLSGSSIAYVHIIRIGLSIDYFFSISAFLFPRAFQSPFYALVDLSSSQLNNTSPPSMQLRPSFSVLLGVLITIYTQGVEALGVPGSKRDMVTVPLKPVQNFQAHIDPQVVSKRNTFLLLSLKSASSCIAPSTGHKPWTTPPRPYDWARTTPAEQVRHTLRKPVLSIQNALPERYNHTGVQSDPADPLIDANEGTHPSKFSPRAGPLVNTITPANKRAAVNSIGLDAV
jgi:hypothetical protein